MSKQTKTTALPRGNGSVQMRRRTYWMIYTDANGKRIQENTYLVDRAAAERLLAVRAVGVLEARLAVLRSILDETPEAQDAAGTCGAERLGHDTGHETRRQPVWRDAAQRGDGAGAARGGKA